MMKNTTAVIDFQAYKTSDQTLIETFLRIKEGKSRLTYKAYQQDIRHFQQCFPGKQLKKITFQDLKEYEDILRQKYALATIHRRIKTLKQLLSYAAKRNYLRLDPDIEDYKLAPLPNQLHERLLTEEEVKDILIAEQHPRNHAILTFLYYTGVRVSELCFATWKDIQAYADGKASVIIHGKHHKSRNVGFPGFVWQELLHLKTHYYTHTTPYSPVFMSKSGRHLTRSRIHTIIKSVCSLAGIDRPVSAHWFRHAYATHAKMHGCPLEVIQKVLGHSSLGITGRYLHVLPQDSPGFYLLNFN